MSRLSSSWRLPVDYQLTKMIGWWVPPLQWAQHRSLLVVSVPYAAAPIAHDPGKRSANSGLKIDGTVESLPAHLRITVFRFR